MVHSLPAISDVIVNNNSKGFLSLLHPLVLEPIAKRRDTSLDNSMEIHKCPYRNLEECLKNHSCCLSIIKKIVKTAPTQII